MYITTLRTNFMFMVFFVFPSFILRVMCGVLGIFVTHQDRSNRNRKAKVLVTNHITTLDHMAIELVMPHIMVSFYLSLTTSQL